MRIVATLLLAFSTATSAGPWNEDLSKDDSRLVIRDFANCMVRQHGRDAKKFVALDPTALHAAGGLGLIHGDCAPFVLNGLNSQSLGLRGSEGHFRYALAEALLLRDHWHSAPHIAVDAPPLPHSSMLSATAKPATWKGNAESWTKYVERTNHDARMSAFGECVVRASPDQAWALLQTPVASKTEETAFAALTPTLARCLSNDRTLQLGKFNVRGTIALNVYRLDAASGLAPRVGRVAQ